MISLSSLPPELVRDIIESTVPHSFHSTTYDERQSTLCSLSLVSRQFRAIAQPLLFEIVWVDSGKGEHLREAEFKSVVLGSKGSGPLEGDKEAWMRSLASVQNLVWTFGALSLLDLSSVASLEHLTSLHLSGIRENLDGSFVPILPRLQSLTLCAVSPWLTVSLVNPTTLPSLRKFACLDGAPNLYQGLQQSALDQLVPQLEFFVVYYDQWLDLRAPAFRHAASRTLINYDDWSYGDAHALTEVVHLRIWTGFLQEEGYERENASTATCILNYTALFVKDKPSLALRSIYLDSLLATARSSLPASLQHAVDDLGRVCYERDIEIVFDAALYSCVVDSGFSAEFARRQKEVRIRKEEQKGK
ncbi:uncharacterized protein JCM6883_007403 [Sporobolomyces salmoneus]|uniref:uncharacterized protein n=1 Tax=Sporobolomyces salmoneus TaxID=183962 RepID=UPI00317DA251